MTAAGAAALAVAALAAVVDWVAVERGWRRLEYVAKPLVLVAVIVAAVSLHPADAWRRDWFVAAFVLSLAGDVLLMLPADLFAAGLGAFLGAHAAFIGGLRAWTAPAWAIALALAVVAAVGAVPAARVALAVRRSTPSLLGPVVVYMGAISLMVASAGAAGAVLATAGASLFWSSDLLIAWDRFVRPLAHGRLAVMVTYHLAQGLLLLSLLH